MKARTLTTKKAIHEEIKREMESRHWEIFNSIASDIAQQTLSNVLLVLEKNIRIWQNPLRTFLGRFKGYV